MQLPQILTSPAGGLWCYCDLSRSPSAQISAGGSLQNIQNIQNFQNMKKIWSSILLEWGIPNKKRLISDTELDLFWEEPHNSFSLPCGDGKSDVGLRSWQEIAVNIVAWSGLLSVWLYGSLTILVSGHIDIWPYRSLAKCQTRSSTKGQRLNCLVVARYCGCKKPSSHLHVGDENEAWLPAKSLASLETEQWWLDICGLISDWLPIGQW